MSKSAIVYVSIIAGLLCLVLFEVFHNRELSARVASLSGQAEVASRPPATGSRDQMTLVAELDATLKENLKLRRAVESGQTQSGGIAGRVAMLKEILDRLPEQRIPQLRYATEADWYAAVDGPLESAEDVRGALARIRAAAEGRFAKILQPALRAYMDANTGSFPKDVGQLQSFLGAGVELAALQHYRIVRSSEIRSVRVGGEWAITQASVVDSEFDSHIVIGPDGFGSYSGPYR